MSTARDFALELKQTIEQIRASGTAAIYCDNLIAYLTEVSEKPSADPSPAELEHMKFQFQQTVEQTKATYSISMENFRAVIAAGQSAIRTMLVLNGGAAVAMLAFIGHLATESSTQGSIGRYATTILFFALGALAAATVSAGTYLGQWFYGHYASPTHVKIGHYLNVAVIVVGLASLGLFTGGMIDAYFAFRG